MEILQTNSFRRAVKKLHANQKADLDEAVKSIMETPDLGEDKVGDLAGISVYKFKMVKQLTLLAYRYEEEKIVLTLLAFGSHENFYRDLKRS
jgi:mRNA-degrading endonuclease YafQ of YafQ-DinJ toxin-antitoxin module